MTTTPLRLGFAGTPEFAATILAGLIASEHQIAVVYSQPDRPTGRGRKIVPGPVKVLAEKHGLPIEQPKSLRSSAAREHLASYQLDALIVAAYGLLLPESILQTPRLGCINVHASILPRWRGAAPIERAILAGDSETGVAIMQMDKGLDTGPVFMSTRTPIERTTTASELHKTLAEQGSQALLEVLGDLEQRTTAPQNDALATLAPKISPADSQIDFSASASRAEAQVRALAHRQPPVLARTLDDGQIVHLRCLAVRAIEGGAGQPQDTEPGEMLRPNKKTALLQFAGGQLELQRLSLSIGKGKAMAISDALNGYAHIFEQGSRWRPTQ
ncbi:MAG: methionyl-tRNA formyltransferase [Pseudomonadaceae bacterium]|nr:methionyl-tRNA formyltransferase [Pseudomonadaceae bacterium]